MDKEPREKEEIERYLVLLLGVVDKPIPSREHLQKELFIASNANPKITQFIKFESHYKGPYSPAIAYSIKEPLHYTKAFCFGKSSIGLTHEGKKIYKQLVEIYKGNIRFKEFLGMLKMIREMYDKLTVDELLLLMYLTYKQYIKYSNVYETLMSRKNEISRKLYEKGLITEKRYLEVLNEPITSNPRQ